MNCDIDIIIKESGVDVMVWGLKDRTDEQLQRLIKGIREVVTTIQGEL